MKSNIADRGTSQISVAAYPMFPVAVFPPSQPRKELTGNVLSLHDAEMRLINSGPAGMRRLALARALDMQELMPSLSDRDAHQRHPCRGGAAGGGTACLGWWHLRLRWRDLGASSDPYGVNGKCGLICKAC